MFVRKKQMKDENVPGVVVEQLHCSGVGVGHSFVVVASGKSYFI